MPEEEWRPSPSFPAYQVSNIGRVRHEGKRKPLTPFVHRKRWCVCLHGHRRAAIESLVAEAFLGADRQKLRTDLTITHRNGDPSDNRPDNLRISPRRHAPKADLDRALAMRNDGLSPKVVEKLTGIPMRQVRSHRERRRRGQT